MSFLKHLFVLALVSLLAACAPKQVELNTIAPYMGGMKTPSVSDAVSYYVTCKSPGQWAYCHVNTVLIYGISSAPGGSPATPEAIKSQEMLIFISALREAGYSNLANSFRAEDFYLELRPTVHHYTHRERYYWVIPAPGSKHAKLEEPDKTEEADKAESDKSKTRFLDLCRKRKFNGWFLSERCISVLEAAR